jgi:thiamine biosynthesis lipoprotein ApbE
MTRERAKFSASTLAIALATTVCLTGCLGEQRTMQPLAVQGLEGALVVSDQNAGELRLAANRFVPLAENILRQLDPAQPESEIAKLNQVGATARLPLSLHTFRPLDLARHYSQLAGRAYDYTARSVTELWRAGTPGEQALQDALARTGMRYIESSNGGTISFTSQGVSIDPGDLALAYAIDTGIIDLRENLNGPFRLDIEGFTRIAGEFREPQIVSIPLAPGRSATFEMATHPALVIRTMNEISALGRGDTNTPPLRIDPRTGRPANGASLVAVAGPMLTKAYVLAEALLVTGWTGGQSMLEKFDDCDVLIVDRAGQQHTTPGFAARWSAPSD